MKKYLIYFDLVSVFVAVFCGCRYNGPSDKEVFDAMEAIMRGFEASMAQDTLEINNEYANSADGVFRSEDDSVITNMTVPRARTPFASNDPNHLAVRVGNGFGTSSGRCG